MDIAMGQRGMYLSVSWNRSTFICSYLFVKMLKHGGMLEPQPSLILNLDSNSGTHPQWLAWLEIERRNRYVLNADH